MTTKPITAITISDRHRKRLGDLTGLVDSIKNVGLIHAIAITPDDKLVAGYRRLEACRSLGWTEIPVQVLTSSDNVAMMLHAEQDENTCRKNFTPTEALAMADAVAAIEGPKAKGRKARKPICSATVAQQKTEGAAERTRTRDLGAKAAGMGRTSLSRIKKVTAIANNPTQPQPVRDAAQAGLDEMDRTGIIKPTYLEVMALIESDKGEPKNKPGIAARKTAKHQVNSLTHAEESLGHLADNLESIFPNNGVYQHLCTLELRKEHVVASRKAMARISAVFKRVTTTPKKETETV